MITRHRCSNGVTIVLEKIPAVRSVSIGVWVGTGSRNETKENNGVSHFLEHMFFKGTTSRNAREIAEAFDRIGGHVNAFTSKEYTCFYSKVLDEHAEHALDLLADMFFHSTFSADEMIKEKSVVHEEIKMYEDTPDEMVHDLLGQACYGDHPLGYPILGSEKVLDSFDSRTLRDYMKKSYTPDNVVISIAGHIDESIITYAEQFFGGFHGESGAAPTESPVFRTDKLARRKDTEQAHLCVGFRGLPVNHEEIFTLAVLNNILGGSMSSRLFQEVREERGLAYSIFSYHSAFRDNGVLSIYGGTGVDRVDEMYTTVHEVLAKLRSGGVTDSELENSKEQIKGNLMLGLESTNSRMNLNAKNEMFLGRHRTLDEMTEDIAAVTKTRVNAMAEAIFSEDFSCSIVSPGGKLPRVLQV
ncbi:MAG TPA: pitrilysin family protein [Bacillales bacterium]|nr:pitrilysin family protein [Bacillales bacterium]